MLNYLLKRLLFLIPTVFSVITLVFFLIHIIPGDPVDFILGENANVQDRMQLVKTLRLDRNLWVQYSYFIKDVLTLNFGRSLFDQTLVARLIASRILPTFCLALLSMVVAISVALPLGFFSALKQNSSFDHMAMGFALLGISIPTFYSGPLLILFFSIKLGWLPVSGFEQYSGIILPALALGLALAAMISRMTRASMLEILKMDFVRTARAKGLKEKVLLVRHVLRCALLPVVTIIGLQFGALLAGAVVTEKVFNWPGLGTLLITEIQRRNYPVVQGCVLTISITYIVVNMLTDIFYAKLDPRVRLG